MMSLAGSYNTLATGYNAIGVNPANLAFEKKTFISILGTNTSISNNLFNQYRLDDISGIYLDSTKKEQIIGYLNDGPIIIKTLNESPLGINFSKNNIAITSKVKTFSSFELSKDFLDIFLNGNSQVGDDFIYSLFMKNNLTIIWETSFSKAFSLDPLGFGFTLKYLRGLLHYQVEPTKEPFFQTTFEGISSKNTYVMNKNFGGEGIALDLGLSTKRLDSGWKFGFSMINLGGALKWNKFSPKMLDLSDEEINQSYLINLTVKDINAQNLNNLPTDEIFIIDSFDVYEVLTLPESININHEDSTFFCSDINCSSYYIESDEYNIDNLDLRDKSKVTTNYPTNINFGFSKILESNRMILFDMVTGMDLTWGNSQNWRLSLGYILNLNKNPFRFGLSYGGYDYKSIGVGYGVKSFNEKINLDFGISYMDNYKFSKSGGLELGFNIYYKK